MEHAFQQTGVATVRKHRLPLEAVLWSIIGVSLFRLRSVFGGSTQMDIMLPDKKTLLAPSAIVQARQSLGSEAVK
ncbi:transposase domain-containing protein [Pseudoalteromonas rhizosphaerae]|uniref:transposase domain-containing protein n=1 Tax=Pseudoalteromonas rhizosphaerae TaxID=2518973 RepID=UPI003CE47E98